VFGAKKRGGAMAKDRKVFEEVGGEKTSQLFAYAHRPDKSARDAWRGQARAWLVILFVLVLAMILVGGLTRLTDSGLSITEWRPLAGALPPMTPAEWQAEFDRYRLIPEYQQQNAGMTLDAFKVIYWWEWGHRQLGRLVGLVWALGFVVMALRRRVPRGWKLRFALLGLMGGLQGAIGWWMVQSGLSGDRLDVAPYRLAVHLGLAFTILGLIAWQISSLARAEMDLFQARRRPEARLVRLSGILVGMVLVQVLLGALVAGTDSGKAFPEWPTMAGQWFPPDAFGMVPWWRNLFEDPGLVQFNHRVWAYLLVLKMTFVWWVSRSSPVAGVRSAFGRAMLVMLAQVGVGIATALYAAPLHAAITHLLLGVVLFVTVIRARFLAVYPPEQKVARGR
jgi:cytochrome c oxidase assembly protein subunit 15